jgi:hypothetical protein
MMAAFAAVIESIPADNKFSRAKRDGLRGNRLEARRPGAP